MKEWLISSPKRRPKSNTRKFITDWLTRNQNQMANKLTWNNSPVDRRTKNIDGTPVTSKLDGLF
jgi:hypothetical protein